VIITDQNTRWLHMLKATLMADNWSDKENDPDALTLLGPRRMDNIQQLVERVVYDGVEGDLMECGVWRGGACIWMRALLDAYGDKTRSVWVADSFQGVPPPDPEQYPADEGLNLYANRTLAVEQWQVRSNFEHFGLLDERVKFLPGWFKDSLPGAPVGKLAVLRLDGDLYQSTWESLTHLYPKVEAGGYVIVDDYGAVEVCAQAVWDYRAAYEIYAPIEWVDWTAVWWQKRV
jgi:O-methyltransferase